jgi:hypothetical protein
MFNRHSKFKISKTKLPVSTHTTSIQLNIYTDILYQSVTQVHNWSMIFNSFLYYTNLFVS